MAEFAVDIDSLVKVYGGGIRALDGVNLNVHAGKIFALLGPNGAGKTTLMRILTTQIRSTVGKAHIFGLDISIKGAEVRKLIGYIPQEMSVWTDISGYENLLIYSKIYNIAQQEREKYIVDTLDAMELGDVAHNLANTYSGGMIRRLEIACAMLIRPKLLFLDEPTIGLDPSARRIVWEKLVSFQREYGLTIFFNTHYMDEADQYSDRIAIINHGRIIKAGTTEELKRSVGGEVLLLETENAVVGKALLGKMKALRLVKEATADNFEMRVIVNNAETILPRVMEILREGGIRIKRVSITKPTLDDVFLKYAAIKSESKSRIGELRQVRGRVARG